MVGAPWELRPLSRYYQTLIRVGLEKRSLAPVGSPMVFAGNGYCVGTTMAFDRTDGFPKYKPGATVYVSVDVFPLGYAAWEAPALGMAIEGFSNVFPVVLGNQSIVGFSPTRPAELVGQEGAIVGELQPSVRALPVVGGVALMLRRSN